MIIATASISGRAMTQDADDRGEEPRPVIRYRRSCPVRARNRVQESSRRSLLRSRPLAGDEVADSLRRLLTTPCTIHPSRAHRRTVAADRVGQVEVADRVSRSGPSALALSFGGAQGSSISPSRAELRNIRRTSLARSWPKLSNGSGRPASWKQRGRSPSPHAPRPAGTAAFSPRCTRPSVLT